jgi:hypothetical protein
MFWPSGLILSEPSRVLVCDSNTGSSTRTLTAAMTLSRMSLASKFFFEVVAPVFTSASRKALRWVPPCVVFWPFTKE